MLDTLSLLFDNYRNYPVTVARQLGSINAAIFLTELYHRYTYHKERQEIIPDLSEPEKEGWFFFTAETCEERTFLSSREQSTAIKILTDLDIIEQKNFGSPCKRHFRFNLEKLRDYLTNSKKDSSFAKTQNRFCENAKPYSTKRKSIYRNILKKHKEEIYNIPPNSPPPPEITPPSPPSHSADASAIFDAFLTGLKKKTPNFKEPNRTKWLQEIDRLLRIDGRNVDQVLEIIEWALQDEWYSTACLSPSKLRKDFDAMLIKKQSLSTKNRKQTNRTWALECKKNYPKELKAFSFDKDFAFNRDAGKEVPFDLPQETFREAFVSMFGGTGYDEN